MGLLLFRAPYLSRLAWERYPAALWPAAGAFAQVAGSRGSVAGLRSDTEDAVFDPRGRKLFEEAEGRALLVYRRGRLKFEHYAAGFNERTRFNSYSMVKSLVGALVMRAHAEGLIVSLQDPIGTYLTEPYSESLRRIPIIDFLRMRSGIQLEAEGAKSAFGAGSKDIERTRLNPFGLMLRLHMLGPEAVAGELTADATRAHPYNYQNVNTAVLGALLAALYGKPLERILSEKIWAPAGAGDAHWRRYGSGEPVSPYCCLYATARDWLRVGVFLLNNGHRQDSFLPELLWRQFLGLDLSYADVKDGRYGLHIYQNVLDRPGEELQGPFTYLFGSRGQVVYLMPERDLVVVRFGGGIQLLHSTLYSTWRSISAN